VQQAQKPLNVVTIFEVKLMSNKQSLGNVKKTHAKEGEKGTDPLTVLQVFDLLEVGPVKVERKRIVVPYRLFQDGREDRTELIYSYEEDVFDPDEEVSQNLASMMAAQVAMNYGLFCRSIRFRGVYDQIDRRLIRDMSENTAREIYVKKFLQPNPFLVGQAAHLPPVKAQRYLRASLEFSDMPSGSGRIQWRFWPAERSRHAILSSGGKDSLLSFGLLNEMGRIWEALVHGSQRLPSF
jgi:hypothetical protein